jgi:hypothetical protein
MLFTNDTLICTIAELIRCSLTRIDTDSDLIIRVLRAIARHERRAARFYFYSLVLHQLRRRRLASAKIFP